MIAITGITGFIGSRFLERISGNGAAVRGLARNRQTLQNLTDVEIVTGDIRDRAVHASLTRDVDCLVHLANLYQGKAASLEEMFAVNVTAAGELFRQAVSAGARRIVLLSTAGVHEHADGVITERTPLRRSSVDPYEQHKIALEQLVREACAGSRTDYVILRPATVYGPGDTRLAPLFNLVRTGRFFFVGSGENRVSWLFVDDLLEAMQAAMVYARASNTEYIVTGPEAPTLRELVNEIARLHGVKPPRRKLPVMPMYLAAWMCEKICGLIRVRPPLYRGRLRFFTDSLVYSNSKIKRELDIRLATTIHAGLSITLQTSKPKGKA